MEILPVVLEKEQETTLLVMHCMPGPLGIFTDDLISTINELPIQNRTLTVGDLSHDLMMLSANVAEIEPLF